MVQGKPLLHSNFEANLGYMRLCLNKQRTRKRKEERKGGKGKAATLSVK